MAAAVRADGDLGVGELLDLFCVSVAGGALVFVERHDFFLCFQLTVMRTKFERTKSISLASQRMTIKATTKAKADPFGMTNKKREADSLWDYNVIVCRVR